MPTITLIRKETVAVKYLEAWCPVRYWEDATVNGAEDTEGTIPCRVRESWCPLIDLDTGTIVNWTPGIEAYIHYKVVDEGVYRLLDEEQNLVKEIDGYVPYIMCPNDHGYGDYVIMQVDANGRIENWTVNLDEFEDDEC